MTAARNVTSLPSINRSLTSLDELLDLAQREIERLRERIVQLEEEIAPSSIIIPVEWRLTGSETRLFAHLTTRDIATKTSIMTALYSDWPDDDPELKIVDVFVCKMRKKVKPYGVEVATIWGQGYSLIDRQKYAVRA